MASAPGLTSSTSFVQGTNDLSSRQSQPKRLRSTVKHANPGSFVVCPSDSGASWRCTAASLFRGRPISSPSRANTSRPMTSSAVSAQAVVNGVPVVRRDPSEQALAIWRTAEAVCFDVDCTITTEDSLDLLAEFMDVKDAVEALTSQAMDGTMNLAESLEARLNLLQCTPSDIKRFIAAHPPETRMTPGIVNLITALKARGVAVYLISGGFRELIHPIAKYLGIPKECVYANRMNWQSDDHTGEPTRLAGFDYNEPTAHNRGKPQAIAKIRERNPYNNIVMVGDGITDLEAVQETGGADLFIGYGGVVERQAVAEAADWFVDDWGMLNGTLRRYRVAMVGSGEWASAVMRIVAQNTTAMDPADEFVDEVKMWVYEEDWVGENLSDVINSTRQNPKYLPGVDLGENVTAASDLGETVRDADVIIICSPRQYLNSICRDLRGKVKAGSIAVSLVKGTRIKKDGPQLVSEMVRKYLGVDCSVLMGASLANDVANEELSEAVIAYNNKSNAELLKRLFGTSYFHVNITPDVAGAEMCGTLKDIVAVASGFIDGLGLGANSKAAIMRQGLHEMRKLSKALFPTVRDDTFFQSCGIADLIATCYGGRNRAVACEYAQRWKEGRQSTYEELESELFSGHELQGTLTSGEVADIISAKGWEKEYPLFMCVQLIITRRLPPSAIGSFREGALQSLVQNTEGADSTPSTIVAELEAATVV